VKLAKIGYVRDIEEVLREVKGGQGASPAPSNPAPPRPPAFSPPSISRPAPVPPAPPRQPTPVPPPPIAEKKNTVSAPGSGSSNFYETFIQRVEDKSGITAVHLQKAERIERTGDAIRVVMQNPTALAMLQSKEHKSVLDSVASDLVGKAVSVSLIMKEDQQKSGPATESAKDEPLVQQFLRVFKGDLAQVKPSKEE
jgi:hypothetical protein